MPDASTAAPVTTTTAASEATPLASATATLPPQSVEPPKAQPPAAQQPVVPEKYDLKLPEGSLLGSDYLEKISSYAKEKGLSNEAAQNLLEREHGAVSSYAESQKQNYEKIVDSWSKAVESDPEIGGGNYKQNVELASRVIKRFGSENLIKALNETGYGNHPELVRVFTRIGKAMSDDQLIIPGSQPAEKPAIYDKFYGSTK